MSKGKQCGLAVTSKAWLAPTSYHPPFEVHFCDIHIAEMQKLLHNIHLSLETALAEQLAWRLSDE